MTSKLITYLTPKVIRKHDAHLQAKFAEKHLFGKILTKKHVEETF